LLICIPPRYSKSLLASVAFPAWVWTWWPSAKFISCSYDQKLATRDSLGTRRLIEHPWYRERWPEVRLERDQHQKMWYQTTAGGVRYVGSPSTGVTGHGADFAEFDDPTCSSRRARGGSGQGGHLLVRKHVEPVQ
jgi:hypothetical protein